MANSDLDIINKIIQFLDGEEWKKYPTYEHALEDLIGKIVQQKTELFSKHILELQADKDKLIDENKQAKEIIRGFMSWGKGLFPTWQEVVSKAEVFLSEVEK